MRRYVSDLTLLSIGLALLFLIVSEPASACTTSTVYDNSGSICGSGGWNCYENGNQITLEGNDRKITSFTFYYSVWDSGEAPFAQVRFLKNDGIYGEPGTVLYDSGKLATASGEGDFSYTITGLNILVPDTFTWSVLLDDTAGVGGEGWYNAQPLVAFPRIANEPTVGAYDTFWYLDSQMNRWFEISDQTILAAKIEASPVPVPNSIFLLASSISGLALLKRKSGM